MLMTPSKEHSSSETGSTQGWGRKREVSLEQLTWVRLCSNRADVTKTHKAAWRGSHGPNLGQSEHWNNSNIVSREWIMKYNSINPWARTNNKQVQACTPTHIQRGEKEPLLTAECRVPTDHWGASAKCENHHFAAVMVKAGSGKNWMAAKSRGKFGWRAE